ncbi:unnamed protein product, partial [marine sediment metagenome]
APYASGTHLWAGNAGLPHVSSDELIHTGAGQRGSLTVKDELTLSIADNEGKQETPSFVVDRYFPLPGLAVYLDMVFKDMLLAQGGCLTRPSAAVNKQAQDRPISQTLCLSQKLNYLLRGKCGPDLLSAAG